MNNELRPFLGDRLRGHQDRVNAIAFDPTSNDILLSASSDHTVCIWDIRSSPTSPVGRITLPDEVAAMDVGFGSLIAASYGNSLVFYDIRQVRIIIPSLSIRENMIYCFYIIYFFFYCLY